MTSSNLLQATMPVRIKMKWDQNELCGSKLMLHNVITIVVEFTHIRYHFQDDNSQLNIGALFYLSLAMWSADWEMNKNNFLILMREIHQIHSLSATIFLIPSISGSLSSASMTLLNTLKILLACARNPGVP